MNLEELLVLLRQGRRAILLVRHAERPKMDPNDPSFGDALALTMEGARTSRLLGNALKEFAAQTEFYSSPLTRTRMTARLIAEGMGIPNAPIPVDDLLGNGSFYYRNASEVLEVFKPKNFFPACFSYFATGEQRGFKNLYAASDEMEAWLKKHHHCQLLIVVTHDLYIAAFLKAKGAVNEFTCDNWVHFLDAGVLLSQGENEFNYAIVRTGLSQGIVGVET